MKIKIFAACLLAMIILACPFTVFAETFPADEVIPTEDIYATEDPGYIETEPVDDPYYTEPATDYPDTTTSPEYTEPYTEPYTEEATTAASEITEPVYTNPPEPTEPDEDSTYSDYVSPEPIYTPADQDFEEKEWQEIQLDLSADPAPGKQSFEAIQNDKSKGNDSIAGFLIVGIVLVFLSIAGFSFVALYNPFKKKKAPAKAGAKHAASKTSAKSSSQRNHFENRTTYNPDDYNDGF